MSPAKVQKRALIAMSLSLFAMVLAPRQAEAQQTASAVVTATATVLAPIQPSILRQAMVLAAANPSAGADGHSFVKEVEGAQVSVSHTLPRDGQSGRAARSITISFVGT